MTDIMAHAVEAIEKKLVGTVFDGSAKFEIEGQGSVIIDASGVRVSDDETEVTLSANLETFQEILEDISKKLESLGYKINDILKANFTVSNLLNHKHIEIIERIPRKPTIMY